MSNGKDFKRSKALPCLLVLADIQAQQTLKGPVAGYDPVLGKVDRRNKKQKNYPKEYVQMFRDANKGNRLKSVMK